MNKFFAKAITNVRKKYMVFHDNKTHEQIGLKKHLQYVTQMF